MIACRISIVAAILLWFVMGGYAWAGSAEPEDSQESEPAGWLARVSGTVRDVAESTSDAVSETLVDVVLTVDKVWLDPAGELVRDIATNEQDVALPAVDDVVKDVEDTVLDPLQGMLSGEGAIIPDTMFMPTDYLASVSSGAFAAAEVVTDVVPEAWDLVLVQVDGSQIAFEELQVGGIDGAVTEAAALCHDYVLVPVDEVGSFVADSYDHVATGLTGAVLDPVGGMVAETLEPTTASLAASGIASRVGATTSAIVDQTRQAIDTTGLWIETAVPDTPVFEEVGLGAPADSMAAGLAAGSTAGARTGVARVAAAAANTWDSLSGATKSKFARRGLRPGMAARSEDMARELYETVPHSIRESGEEAVRQFLDKYDLSHIKPVSKFPELADNLDNVVWEAPGINRGRGDRIMTPEEIEDALKALELEDLQARDKLTRKFVLKSLGRGQVLGAIVEAPVVSLENFFHVRHGRMTRDEAIRDGLTDTATSIGVGAVISGVTYLSTQALAATGVSATVGAAAAPVAVGAVALYGGYTIYRLCRAAQPSPPGPPYSTNLNFPH
ncbi:MAG: hypothetical protein F4X16_07340 [Caldilineaceae bacterium SB0661_bin_34]|nr:hypothetical protein [Caldilineaceae bacterium SB0661_bin_34]